MTLSRLKMFFIFFLFILPFSKAREPKYTGFSNTSNQELLTMNESVERFIENKSEFLILFIGHQSFYSFPKKRNHEVKFKAFLESQVTKGNLLKIIYNPRNAQIISIEKNLQ